VAETSSTPISPPDIVPKDTISQAAFAHAAKHLHPSILNHSIRVFLYAQAIAERENSEWAGSDRLPLLFTACILHDIGTTSLYNGPLRFEVEGADAATSFLKEQGVSEADAHEVWVAIAIHTSHHIAERISTLARLVRLGVSLDFKRPSALELTTPAEVEHLEARFPRGPIEKVLGDSVADQAVEKPEKAPGGSWPGNLYRAKLENPGWEGVNKGF
jgi:hypothetical protein